MSFIYCEALVVVMLNCVLSVHVGVLAFLTQQYIHPCVHLLYPVMIVHCVMDLCPLYSSHYGHVLMAHFYPSPPHADLPIAQFQSNPQTVLIVPQRGGHFGFIEGLFPFGPTWMDRILRQCLKALRDSRNL